MALKRGNVPAKKQKVFYGEALGEPRRFGGDEGIKRRTPPLRQRKQKKGKPDYTRYV